MKSSSPDSAPINILSGVGTLTARKLEKLGLFFVQDLLFHLPYRYEDRTRLIPLGSLRAGDHALVEGAIEAVETMPSGKRSLVLRIGDGTGYLNLRFFHFAPQYKDQFKRGRLIRCYGEIRNTYFGLEITHPDYEWISESEKGRVDARLTPVYPLTEGIHQKAMRRMIGEALKHAVPERLQDFLPAGSSAVARFSLCDALHMLHLPPSGLDENSPEIFKARRRLAFEELLAHHLSIGRFRLISRQLKAPVLSARPEVFAEFHQRLPFRLTSAQQRVIDEILADLSVPRPMMRLLQGDVGSGKTVVAAFAALAALAGQHQVAVMAPTELLAEQHFRTFKQWLEPIGVSVLMLSGRIKGTERRSGLETIANGQAGVVIGTHALFQDQVIFSCLGLIIIDEQHRFGVHQRLALREKGRGDGVSPHQLIMTATPIPRTLAMLGYADLDFSVINERPPGRTPVNTLVVPTSKRSEIIARVTDWVARGRQVYWVCTLIEESELLEAEAAEKTAEMLVEALPRVRSSLVHGRMKADEKERVMQAFKAGETDLLVATTVIEVGVDVPNAGLMVIENAERLGLAQLHQLRGRIGRGPGESHCVLLYQPPLSPTARDRLGILRETDDGFLIAEKDLEIRGPGEVLGTRQTGLAQFRVANLQRDGDLLEEVKECAGRIHQQYPDIIEPLIQRWVGHSVQYVEA